MRRPPDLSSYGVERDDDDTPPRCGMKGCKETAVVDVTVSTLHAHYERWEVAHKRLCTFHAGPAVCAMGEDPAVLDDAAVPYEPDPDTTPPAPVDAAPRCECGSVAEWEQIHPCYIATYPLCGGCMPAGDLLAAMKQQGWTYRPIGGTDR